MARTCGSRAPLIKWLALAGFPLAIVGCQNETRSDSTNTNAVAASSQPSTMRLDDVTKTNMLLRQLHAANQEEIDVGKMAQDKAPDGDVKKFAIDMVSDHTSADQKLTDLAKRSNIDLSATSHDPVQQALMSTSDEFKRNLRSLSGMQFEVAYVAPQVEKHQFVLKVIDEAQKTASGDVKKLLDETRPTVESHLEHAKSMQRNLSFGPAAVGGGPGTEKGEKGEMVPAAGKDGGKHDTTKEKEKEHDKERPKTNP